MHRSGSRCLPIEALPILVVACALAVGFAGLWVQALLRAELPDWVVMRIVTLSGDFDGDGETDLARLASGNLEISDADGRRYQTPRAWVVTDAFARDLDGDGVSELVLGVWKRGSFGTSQPFWVQHDTSAMTQHVFVVRYGSGALSAVWMSSSLGEDVRSIRFDEQGLMHIVEGSGAETSWRWDQWGFTLADEGDGLGEMPGLADDSPGSSQEGRLSLLAVGDNIAHAGIYDPAFDAATGAFDFSSVYEHVTARVASYDLAAVCQETPLVEERSAVGDYPDFGTPVEMGDALAAAGFDIVAAATNHAFDRGLGGLDDTLAFWGQRHPEAVLLGLHEGEQEGGPVAFVSRNGIRLALIDATYGLNGHVLPDGLRQRIDTLEDVDSLLAAVEQAESEADATVCFLHVGEEYAADPTDEQRQVVDRFIEAGADLVICTHPHVVQPCERVTAAGGKSAVVYWSLGNFASRQADVRAVLGGAADVVFERGDDGCVTVSAYDFVPLVCHQEEMATTVYFLDDYTDELAARHVLSAPNRPFTVALLRALWDEEVR